MNRYDHMICCQSDNKRKKTIGIDTVCLSLVDWTTQKREPMKVRELKLSNELNF